MAVKGEAIKGYREGLGWSATYLASRVGISPQYLSDIEHGRRTLDRKPRLVIRLAHVLGVSKARISDV